MAHVRRTSIPRIAIFIFHVFFHEWSLSCSLCLCLCSLFHSCSLSLSVTHLLALSSLIHQRGWGFARAVWRKDVTRWDCGIVVCRSPCIWTQLSPMKSTKTNSKKKKRTHLHLCISPELPSCQTAQEPSASEDTKGVLQSSCQMQSHLMQITAPHSHTHTHTPDPHHICYARWGLATTTPWRFLKHTYERVNFQSITSY